MIADLISLTMIMLHVRVSIINHIIITSVRRNYYHIHIQSYKYNYNWSYDYNCHFTHYYHYDDRYQYYYCYRSSYSWVTIVYHYSVYMISVFGIS